MTNNMASSGLRENVTLTKIILTTDDTNGCATETHSLPFGKEFVTLFWEWEDLAKKMADFSNHRMFTLGCLKARITSVSLWLKNNIRIPRGLEITRIA